jgi:hypothetical protein
MKTPLLLLVTLVLGIAIGMLVDRGGAAQETREKEPATTRSARARQATGQGAAGTIARHEVPDAALAIFLEGRKVSQIPAQEAYRLLDPDRKMTDDPVENARSQYQFELLAPQLSDAVLEEVITRGLKDGVKTPRLYQLFGIYSSRDWDRAMAWLADKPDREMLKDAGMSALAKTDPVRGSDIYQKEVLAGWKGTNNYNPACTLAKYHLGQGPADFFRFFDSLPASETKYMVSFAVESVRAEDMPEFIGEVGKRVASGTLDRNQMQEMMLNACVDHPEAAMKWIDSHETEIERSYAGFGVAVNLEKAGKHDEALEFLKGSLAGSPGKEKELMANYGISLLSAFPGLLRPMVDMLPAGQELTNEDVRNWTGPDPHNFEKILTVSKLLGPDERSGYMDRQAASLTRWFEGMNDGANAGRGDDENLNASDFKLLSEKLDSLGLTGHAAETTRAALEKAKQRAVGK